MTTLQTQTHTHSPGDFCFIQNGDFREALGEAYATTQKHNLWGIFRDHGTVEFTSRLAPIAPIDLFRNAVRKMAYLYMGRIATYGWDAFVAYYEEEIQKPLQPCVGS
jgi:hypothetical protein